MRKTLKKICTLTIAVMLLLTFALPCFAAQTSGSISVCLEDKDKNKIDGVTVYLCQVAQWNSSGYSPVSAFKNSGISVSGIVNDPDESTAKSVVDYIKNNKIDTLSSVSQNGNTSFTNLNLGIWVVFCGEDSKYTFNPYIVFLPHESEGKLCYDVSSVPKIQSTKSDVIGIYVIKKWNDKNNAAKKRPDSVYVELVDGSAVISSVELSESNGWAYTFTNLSKDGDYSVREKGVTDYKATYSGDAENGFIITNSYVGEKLPQTGQYWWPIVIIAVAGVAFVLLGLYEIGVKKNGKKK